jgi:hypothetical protein
VPRDNVIITPTESANAPRAGPWTPEPRSWRLEGTTPSFVSRSNIEVKAALNLSADAAPLLPRAWPLAVKSAILHVISLARLALVHTRSWAADSPSTHLRLKSERDETRNEIALLGEEIRIKDARRTLVDPHRRPRYPPTERLSILELCPARAWLAAQTARTFMLEPATIAEWMGRVDEGGDSALVKTAEPVNRFPDFVRHMVRRLKTLSPSMGKKRLAQTLARAGIHLALSTVGRILKEKQRTDRPTPAAEPAAKRQILHTPVVSKYPNHVGRSTSRSSPR